MIEVKGIIKAETDQTKRQRRDTVERGTVKRKESGSDGGILQTTALQ